MQGVIQKIGNSKGVRIPKRILENLNMREHDIVEIHQVDEGLLIKKTSFPYKSLDELFEGYDGDYRCYEWDFGEDVGREKVW